MDLVEINNNGDILNFNSILDVNNVKVYFLPLADSQDVTNKMDSCIEKSNSIIKQINNSNK